MKREEKMETIDNDVRITINLTDLVNIRVNVLDLEDELDETARETITNGLRTRLTWDTLYYMIDNELLDYVGKADNHYGEIANDAWLVEIEKNKKQFEMVDLVAPAWTIQVPRRIKK